MGPLQRLHRERPRSDQRRGPGGLRQGEPLIPFGTQHDQAGASSFAAGLLALRPHLAYLDVRPHGTPGEDEAPLQAPLDDPDRVRRWIADYGELTIAQSGSAPPGMPSAFVLQHHLDPFAQVVATAAVRGTWVLDPDPARWHLVLEPTYRYPVAVRVAAGQAREVSTTAERLDAAAAGYRDTARRIALAFPAAEKMSSRQRLGMVDDMWEIAIQRLVGGPPPQRETCCLIYAIPGRHECAGCPRIIGSRGLSQLPPGILPG